MHEDRLKRLAEKMDRLVEQDERTLAQTRAVEAARRVGAVELFGICESLVGELNRLLVKFRIELSPEEYSREAFRESGLNLFQINARGRLVQLAFESTESLTSSENYARPYILQGAVRWYNQEALEGGGIEEEMIFYCMDGRGVNSWRYLDAKTRRSGALDEEHLAQLLERL